MNDYSNGFYRSNYFSSFNDWLILHFRCNDAINSSSEGENDGEYIGVLDMAGFEMMMVLRNKITFTTLNTFRSIPSNNCVSIIRMRDFNNYSIIICS